MDALFFLDFLTHLSSNLTELDSIEVDNENDHAAQIMAREREANLILTCLYFVVEVARRLESFDKPQVALRDAVGKNNPST